MKEYVVSPETRKRMSEAAKKRCQTTEFRERVLGQWQPFCSREQLVADYIDANMTKAEVAVKHGVTTKRVETSLRRYEIPTHRAVKRDQKREKNSYWKGDEATNAALHYRVEAARGKPSECAFCCTTDPSVRYEWANLTGKYTDVSDFARLCVYCHRRYDAARRKVTGRITSMARQKEVHA